MELKTAKTIQEDYPENWPPKDYFVNQNDVTRKQLEELKSLIYSDAGETDIDKFLKQNPEVLSNSLDFLRTGHHGSWIISKQVIKPPTTVPGLIPDLIIGGKSSDGFEWCVIDLKGANESIFTETGNRVYFNSTTNMGIFQILEYIDYCAKTQVYMRDILSLVGFREPKGLLLIGREKEMENNIRRQELKLAWNSISTKIQVRTYDFLIRTIEKKITFFESQATKK
jgi:hypothetical protein